MTVADGAKRGVKRKRDTDDVARKLRTKFHHERKEVVKAVKKAKVFETQRIVRRLKDARKANDTQKTSQLEAELDTLKHIDHDQIASHVLRSKLKKDPILSKNADCLAALSEELPDAPAPDTVKTDKAEETDKIDKTSVVKARLLSSKTLAQTVMDVISSLRAVLGQKEADEKVGSGSGSWEDSGNEDEAGRPDVSIGRGVGGNESGDEDDGKDNGESEEESEEFQGFGIDEEDEEGVHEDETADLSDEPDDDDGWESGTVHNSDSEAELSDAESSNSDSPPSKIPRTNPNPSKASSSSKPAATKTKASESTFLPSLSVGFIRGSDSDWSDGDAEAGDIPARKNRRGQRARKAIWEKKYGKNANHIKKQREEEHQGEGPSSSTAGKYGNFAARGRGGSQGRAGFDRGRGRGPGFGSGSGSGRAYGADRGSYQTGGTATASANGVSFSRPTSERGRGGKGSRGRGSFPDHGSRHPQDVRGGGGGGSGSGANQTQPLQRAQSKWPGQAAHTDNSNSNHFSEKRKNSNDDNRSSKPLHPSWEAKKRLKEKQSAAIVPAQGTRIKFD